MLKITGKGVSRFGIGKDSVLAGREIFGPTNLGKIFLDNIAFDPFDNLSG